MQLQAGESPQSPFVPGTRVQWAWDSTSLGWFKECPRKYYYHMIEGWSPRGERVHLEFGIIYHKALEFYDRLRATGISHNGAVEEAVNIALKLTWREGAPWRSAIDLDPADRASLKCREYLIRTIVWYLEKFKDDPAKTMLMADGTPMVEMHFQFEIDMSYAGAWTYALCGYLDRVVEFNGLPFVMDRKTTTTTLSTAYFDQFDPDNQMSMYTVAALVAFKQPIKGVIVDAAQIMVGQSRFVRSIVQKTAETINEWLMDTKIWIKQATYFAEKSYWPMNDKSCHKYGGCPFRHICQLSPSVRPKFLESHFERHEWNPLELRG